MNNYSNANSSGCTSEQRKQNVVDTVGKFKSNYAEAREAVVKAAAGDGIIYNENSPLDTRELFSGLKFSEQRYASAKCRIDIAKSYLCDAKKHLKKDDDIAALAYMQCSMNHASRAMLELKEECDEKHIDIMTTFERKYINTKLFSRNSFLFWQKISYVFDKIVRGDFFRWPRESFSEDLKRTSIFIEDAEEVLSCYYKYTNKEIENQ